MSTTDKPAAHSATDLLASANTTAAQAADVVKTATAQAAESIETSAEYVKSSETVAVSWFGVRWLAR